MEWVFEPANLCMSFSMITQQGLEISSQNLRHPSVCDFNIEKNNVTWLDMGHRWLLLGLLSYKGNCYSANLPKTAHPANHWSHYLRSWTQYFLHCVEWDVKLYYTILFLNCSSSLCMKVLLLSAAIIDINAPCAGSGVVRMDPLRFLAGCRTRRLNQA